MFIFGKENLVSFIKTPKELYDLSQMKIEFYNAEMVFAFWLTKVDIVERLLPPPLKPAGVPISAGFIANYPRTSFGPPYQEGALFLMAQFEEVVGNN
jgi:acetoacetate decarboxylase